jgi:hypothetical protein
VPASISRLKSGREALRCRPGALPKMRAQTLQRAVVVVDHLPQPVGQAGEGQLVARQDQLIRRREGLQLAAGVDPLGHRDRLGFGRVDPEIGRNRRQKLIAADHDLAVLGPQRCVVGRMAMTEAHHPVAPAEAQALPLLDPREAQRHRRDHIGEVEGTFAAPGVEDLRRHARPRPERDLLRRRGLLFVERQHAREKPCRPRHQKLRPTLLEPAGEAHVIGVVMGDEHPPDRCPGKRTGQRRVPRRPAAPRVQPGVDRVQPSSSFSA